MYSTRLLFSRHLPHHYQSIQQFSSLNPNLKEPVEQQKKQSIFNRIDSSLEKQRQKLEQDLLSMYQSGHHSKRLTPEMKKKYQDFLSMEKTMQQRHHLMQEAFQKGYFDEAKEIIKVGPKLWHASDTLFPEIESQFFPSIEISSLADASVKHNLMQICAPYKVSLVAFVFSAFGEPHAKSFVDPFLLKYKQDPNVGFFQINVEENKFKVPVVWMLRPFFRASIPKELRSHYYTLYENISDQRKKLGMTNAVLGWVNLVDRHGKIRWQAHGAATEKEIESLLKLANDLNC
jgi:hypothetical protein